MLDWLRRLFGGKAAAASSAGQTPSVSPILTLEELRALVRRVGYGEAEAEIVALAAPVFHIIAGPSAHGAPLGGTRLGGAPDLPAGSVWPRGRFGPAAFLGQFDLADVRARTGSDLALESGLLSLFVVEIDSAADPVELLAVLTPEGAALERLSPPAEEFGAYIGLLEPISIAAFQSGIGLSQGAIAGLELETRFPDGDVWTFLRALVERPVGAIGEWFGQGFGRAGDDQRQVAHARRIGRPSLKSYAFIESWAKWEELKTIQSRLANGSIYRPWSEAGDDDVRWLLDNRAAFDAGVDALRLLVRIDSNREMGLWINDADPIFVFVDAADLARGDLSKLHATVTQG
ncbi:DUF1963 domain-containing protein [Caulobacter mirabilis]|uniref:DUF1963 domain-containing protein n=1 Tax=Caulobacter mirabilis TaxID=69666 RepID=A0A2D2AUK2_9CAUL|nr:DUF1963 domain-containing protein [Caulobacter mirabilis]ATQ41647.1 hypothetical protein CSW64_04070 [Caulobacter mirabilis]